MLWSACRHGPTWQGEAASQQELQLSLQVAFTTLCQHLITAVARVAGTSASPSQQPEQQPQQQRLQPLSAISYSSMQTQLYALLGRPYSAKDLQEPLAAAAAAAGQQQWSADLHKQLAKAHLQRLHSVVEQPFDQAGSVLQQVYKGLGPFYRPDLQRCKDPCPEVDKLCRRGVQLGLWRQEPVGDRSKAASNHPSRRLAAGAADGASAGRQQEWQEEEEACSSWGEQSNAVPGSQGLRQQPGQQQQQAGQHEVLMEGDESDVARAAAPAPAAPPPSLPAHAAARTSPQPCTRQDPAASQQHMLASVPVPGTTADKGSGRRPQSSSQGPSSASRSLPTSPMDELAAAVKKGTVVDAVGGVVTKAAYMQQKDVTSTPAICVNVTASHRTTLVLVVMASHDAFSR